MKKIPVIEIDKSPKQVMIDPLQPVQKQMYVWQCNRCGQKHRAAWKPRIFNMTDEGLKPAECLKDL